MDDEEKKFVNEEESEEKEEEKETGSKEVVEDKKGSVLVKIVGGILKVLLFPFRLIYKGIKNYPKVFLVIFLVLIAVAGTVYLARTKPELLGISTDQEEVDTGKEAEELISEVSKLIKLPDENPTIATVTDVGKLSDQPFFASAENGDKVLIYTNSRKIYLYRPSEKRIIDASVINITQKDETITETPTPEGSPSPTGGPEVKE